MADSTFAKRIGATPSKLAAIAVLAVALVAAMLFPAGDAAPEASPTQRRPRNPASRHQPSSTLNTRQVAASVASPQNAAPRAAITLEEAIAHDPFAASPELASRLARAAMDSSGARDGQGQLEEHRAQVDQFLAELRNKGVQMVLVGGNDTVAIIGNRSVRVGDMLGGLRVTSITSRGITLADLSDQ